MRSAKKTLNLPLVSLTDGKLVGEIKDFYFDSEQAEMVAVQVGQKGLINPKPLVVKRDAVQVFGKDVWLVREPEVVTELVREAGEMRFQFMHDVTGREIVTSGGTKIGTVGDVWLDERAHVEGFGLEKVFIKGPVAEKKFIPLQAVQEWGTRGQNNPMVVDLSTVENMLAPE